MNAHGCMGGLFSFVKYGITEKGVGLVSFFNKMLITIILGP